MWSHPPISYDHFNRRTKTFCKNITANRHQQSHHTDGAAAANTLVVKLRSLSWWSVWLQPKHLCEMCQLKNLSMNSWFTTKSPVFNVMWRSKTQKKSLTSPNMQGDSLMAPQHPRKPTTIIRAPAAIRMYTPATKHSDGPEETSILGSPVPLSSQGQLQRRHD